MIQVSLLNFLYDILMEGSDLKWALILHFNFYIWFSVFNNNFPHFCLYALQNASLVQLRLSQINLTLDF